MTASDLYVEAIDLEIAEWLVAQAEPLSPQPGAHVKLWSAQQHTVLAHLGVTMAGAQWDATGLVSICPNVLHFRIVPVGQGRRTVVTAQCQSAQFRPCWDKVMAELRQRWPPRDELPHGEPFQVPEQRWGELRLRASLPDFEAEVAEFVKTYRSGDVRYASFTERQDHWLQPGQWLDRQGAVLDRSRRRSWVVHLALSLSERAWSGLSELTLDVEATRKAGSSRCWCP